MRLTQYQITSIKDVAANVFGSTAQVYLFGSRIDDERRGGDIDLYVEGAPENLELQSQSKLHFLVQLKQKIGEQRIDVLLAPTHAADRLPIHTIARQQGVLL